MKRRSFLQILGLGAATAVLPAKADIYEFGERTIELEGDAFKPVIDTPIEITKVVYKTGSINTPEALKKWDEELLKENMKETIFSAYIGNNS